MSAEFNLKTVKLASTRYLDGLPTSGNEYGRAFRDLDLEAKVQAISQGMGIGAQFGGKYFTHEVRVIRLPRHGASCPVGMGVSCSADRQVKAKITRAGVYLEQLETDPAKYLPDVSQEDDAGEVINVDLSRPMDEIRSTLSKYPVKTRLALNGTIVVARDLAHAKLKERLDAGEDLPEYRQSDLILPRPLGGLGLGEALMNGGRRDLCRRHAAGNCGRGGDGLFTPGQ
jgi:fumarate hydratase class I